MSNQCILAGHDGGVDPIKLENTFNDDLMQTILSEYG